MSTDSLLQESIFSEFNFKQRGGNSNFRLLKELLIAQEKLEQKINLINQEKLELQTLIQEVKSKV